MQDASLTGKRDTSTDTRKLTANDNTPGAADFPAKKLPPLPPEYERGLLTTQRTPENSPAAVRRSIFDYQRRGVIPSIQLGSKILYHRESVIAALLRRQQGGVAQ